MRILKIIYDHIMGLSGNCDFNGGLKLTTMEMGLYTTDDIGMTWDA